MGDTKSAGAMLERVTLDLVEISLVAQRVESGRGSFGWKAHTRIGYLNACEALCSTVMRSSEMNDRSIFAYAESKVPAATSAFWVLKLIATTVGEIAGNLVSMSWLGETTARAGQEGVNGYFAGTAMFGLALLVTAWVQIHARRFNKWRYWATIVASTTFGTTLADFATRSLGIGYTGGSLLLLGLVMVSLLIWKMDAGRISADVITSRNSELHYWVTITFSQTLGTALGDWFADTAGLGYAGSTAVFTVALAIIAALYFTRRANPVLLFWAAFIISRPFGAVFGNLFDKPTTHGGYGISRGLLTSILLMLMMALLWLLPQGAKVGQEPVTS